MNECQAASTARDGTAVPADEASLSPQRSKNCSAPSSHAEAVEAPTVSSRQMFRMIEVRMPSSSACSTASGTVTVLLLARSDAPAQRRMLVPQLREVVAELTPCVGF